MFVVSRYRTKQIKVSFYQISKLLFAGYVVFSQAIRYTPFSNQKITTILLVLSVFFNILGTNRVFMGKYITWFAAFIIYALVTGAVVIVGQDPFVMSMRHLLEYFVSFYLIYSFSKEDRNIDFSVIVFIILAVAMSFFNLVMGEGINRITFSENLNVNTIAIVMMFAIGFVLYCFIREKVTIVGWAIGFSLIALFIYMILITVSKKAILGTGFLIGFWALWCTGKKSSNSPFRKLILFCVIMGGLYFGYDLFVKYMPTQYEYLLLRMSQLAEGSSSDKRRELIIQGFEVFSRYPIIGVGLNNFRFYTSYNTYSHCFYSELFACTGLFGASLFFIPFFTGVKSALKRFFEEKDMIVKNQIRFIIAILICLMGTSIAQIIFYEYELIFILGVICASKCIERTSIIGGNR